MKTKLIILVMALSLGLGMTSCGIFWDDMPPGGYYDGGPGPGGPDGPGGRFDAPHHGGGDRGPGGGGHFGGGR